MKFVAQYFEKPWGRTDLSYPFAVPKGHRIGEVWFTSPTVIDPPLLIKYLFTSEALSIQVHPDDLQARKLGLPSGKTENWYILDAEPGAVVGIGLRYQINESALRASVLDGSIKDLVDWWHVRRGDFFIVPAGTIHAIGAGISLVEIQQNVDITYRLYDYGRSRALHVEDGIAASNLGPCPTEFARPAHDASDVLLGRSKHFSVFKTTSVEALWAMRPSGHLWIIPLSGEITSGPYSGTVGDCLLVKPDAPLTFGQGTEVLVAEANLRVGKPAPRHCEA